MSSGTLLISLCGFPLTLLHSMAGRVSELQHPSALCWSVLAGCVWAANLCASDLGVVHQMCCGHSWSNSCVSSLWHRQKACKSWSCCIWVHPWRCSTNTTIHANLLSGGEFALCWDNGEAVIAWERCHPCLQVQGHREEDYVFCLTWAAGFLPGSPFPWQQKICMIMKLWQSRQKMLTEEEKHSGQSHIITVNPL